MPSNAVKFCAVVPCYGHSRVLADVLARIQSFIKDCVVVDDGSPCAEAEEIKSAVRSFPNVTLVTLEKNKGKGGAVIVGLHKAAELGFTHAAQIDADGQHAIEDLPSFLSLSESHPEDCVCGYPIYDQSVPKSRELGRKITDFWVAVETLSFSLKDSMCGFRIYPICKTLEVAQSSKIGMGMDFDTDILVRLYWSGMKMLFLPVRVTYPKDGVSNFKVLRDNWLISKMHTRLFFESLTHVRSNLARRSEKNSSLHWAKIQERRGVLGVNFLLAVYKLGGRQVFRLFCAPVVTCFWAFGKNQRKASQDFQQRVFDYSHPPHQKKPFSSLSHFLSFADALLDKIIVWTEGAKLNTPVKFADEETVNNLLTHQKREGRLLLVSHLGSVEAMRAIGEIDYHEKIYILLFDKNAKNFKNFMKKSAPKSQLNLIEIDEIDLSTIISLKEKIEAGAWIAIAADRIPLGLKERDDKRVIEETFLGKKALFPIGPYVLASLLGCPVYTMFAVRDKDSILISAHRLTDKVSLPRKDRINAVRQYSSKYVKALEEKAVSYPLQWFNFYDFWDLHNDNQ